MGHKSRRSVFVRFFVSYVLIGIVPVIVFGSLFYYYNVIRYEKDVKEVNFTKLEQVKNQIDLDLKVLKDITYHISNNAHVVKMPYSSLEKGEYEGSGIVAQLQAYKENSPFLDDIMIYYRGDKNLYVTGGYYYYYDFETQVKKDLNWSKSGFFKELNSLIAPKVKRIETENGQLDTNHNLLVFMYPIPYLSTMPEATIGYMMQEADFLSAIENLLGVFEGHVFVFDNSNHLLVSDHRSPYNIDKNSLTEKMSAFKGTGVQEIRMENRNYAVMRTVSQDNGWSYVVVMPVREFFKDVDSMRNIAFAIIFALILTGLILAFILSNSSYRPIQRLILYIKNQDSQEVYDEEKNELEMIRFSFERNYQKNRELIVQVNAQRSFVRDQCLVKILRGKVKDIQDLDYLLKCSNLELQGVLYFTMVLSTQIRGEKNINVENLLSLLEDIFFAGARGYGVELVQEKMIAITVSLEKESDDLRKMQMAIAKDVSALVETNLGVKPDIGIGNTYIEILQINTSFLEASSALYENQINHKSNIFFFSDIKEAHEDLNWYPIMEQSLYIQSLKQGDKVVAVETAKAMIDAITEKTTSYFMVRCLCFDIINNILKSINSMNIENFHGDIKKLTMFHTLDEFREEMEKFSREFCEYMDEFKERRNNELKNNIIKYVNDNYRRDHISLDDIADQFEISSTYVSRFFKDETGTNFMEYITSLRMEYVKKQLRNTEKSIKDIGMEVGYIDASSFSRKFRMIEGITPGQYRKMTKQMQ